MAEIDDAVQKLREVFEQERKRIVEQVWYGISWIWENQDPSIPDDQKDRDTPAKAIQAGNGQIYRDAKKLDQALERLDRVEKKLDQLLARLGN